MADLIQMGANIATVVCPLGPRIRSFVGRKDNPKAGPTGLLPEVTDSADKLINLFNAKTIDPHDLAALLGAHTTSQQHFVNTARDGDPQDSTPCVWDVAFYGETISSSSPPRVFKFASDVVLAKDPRVRDEWNEFINGQDHWNEVRPQEPTSISKLTSAGLRKCIHTSFSPRRQQYQSAARVHKGLATGEEIVCEPGSGDTQFVATRTVQPA